MPDEYVGDAERCSIMDEHDFPLPPLRDRNVVCDLTAKGEL